MAAKASLYIRPEGSTLRVKIKKFTKGRPVLPIGFQGDFYVRVKEGDNRVWKRFATVDEALTGRANIITNLDRQAEGLAPLPVTAPIANNGHPTINSAVAQFIADCEARIQGWRNGDENGLSPATVTAYRRAAKNFAASCAAVDAVSMAELADPKRGAVILKNHKDWLQTNTERRTGKAAYSDSRQFVVLNQLLAGYGIKMQKDRTVNPQDIGILRRQDVPKVKKLSKGDVVYYTPADIEAMLSATSTVRYKQNNNAPLYDAQDLRDLTLILFWTGLRDAELQHLEWSDIVWRNGDGNGKIIVQDKPQYDWRVKDHEKRVVKMTPKLRTLLEARQKRVATEKWQATHRGHSKTLLFSTSVGTPNQNFADFIGALQDRAELGEVERKNPTDANRRPYEFSRPECRSHILHNFRKTWATWQSVSGVPAQNIQYMLGHSELSTTERYLALVDEPEKERSAFDAIG